jgi:hypothetical protein
MSIGFEVRMLRLIMLRRWERRSMFVMVMTAKLVHQRVTNDQNIAIKIYFA